MSEFGQPKLDDQPQEISLPQNVVPVEVDNTGKTDELSLAVAAEAQRNVMPLVEPEKLPLKYALVYNLEGKEIVEQHASIEAAVARVRALKTLNIIPATHTL